MTPERVTTDAVLVTPESRRDMADEVALGYLVRYNGNSRKNHTVALRQWFEFCEHHGIPVLSARRAHIDLYTRHMEEACKYLRSTVAAKQSVIIGFYRYAVEEGYLPISPAQYVKRTWAERVSTTQYLTRAEMHTFLEVAHQSKYPHDHAVACLLGLNGLRVGELVGIDLEHFGADLWHPTLFIPMRKGGKAQTLPLAAQTAFAVRMLAGDRTSGPLFVMPKSGQRMDRNQAARIVRRLARLAGVTKKISPHSLRHSYITLSLNAGATTRDVMISAGHADERMTAYYDRAKEQLSRNTTFSVAAFIEGVD